MKPESLSPQHVGNWIIVSGRNNTWIAHAKKLHSDDDTSGITVDFLRSSAHEWEPSNFTFDYGWRVLAKAESEHELRLLHPEYFI